MNVTSSEPLSLEHEPSEPPDERALFSRLAASMALHRRAVIITWLVVAFAAAPLALTLSSALSGAGWEAQGSIAQLVRDELRKNFGALGAENPIVVYHQSTPITSDPSGLDAVVAKLRHAPDTTGVVDPMSVPAGTGLISRDGRTALIPVAQNVTSDVQRPIAAGKLGTYVDGLPMAVGQRRRKAFALLPDGRGRGRARRREPAPLPRSRARVPQRGAVLVVSHQKRTMEAADVLYGVSMPPAGRAAS